MYTDEFENLENLPKITDKQHRFVQEFYKNKKNRVVAYRIAYNSEGKYETCWKEATKLLNNPLIIPYIEFYEKQYIQASMHDVRYSVQDAFNELNEIYETAMEAVDKSGIPQLSNAIKAVELKCKLKGYGKENIELNSEVTVMPSVKIGGKNLVFDVGENAENDSGADNNTTNNIE